MVSGFLYILSTYGGRRLYGDLVTGSGHLLSDDNGLTLVLKRRITRHPLLAAHALLTAHCSLCSNSISIDENARKVGMAGGIGVNSQAPVSAMPPSILPSAV